MDVELYSQVCSALYTSSQKLCSLFRTVTAGCQYSDSKKTILIGLSSGSSICDVQLLVAEAYVPRGGDVLVLYDGCSRTRYRGPINMDGAYGVTVSSARKLKGNVGNDIRP